MKAISVILLLVLSNLQETATRALWNSARSSAGDEIRQQAMSYSRPSWTVQQYVFSQPMRPSISTTSHPSYAFEPQKFSWKLRRRRQCFFYKLRTGRDVIPFDQHLKHGWKNVRCSMSHSQALPLHVAPTTCQAFLMLRYVDWEISELRRKWLKHTWFCTL